VIVGEHQLEAYRALGFHMLYEILDEDLPEKIKAKDPSAPDFVVRQREGHASVEETKIDALQRLRAALIGRPFHESTQ
jgi:hypothetical protein